MRRADKFSPEIPRLLRLLGSRNDQLDWPDGQWDWKPFAHACDYHQVTAYVYCKLKDSPQSVPIRLLEHLRQRFYQISARNYALAQKLGELTVLLQSEGIPVLAYKGPALAMMVYGDLARRQYQDLDVIVRKEDLVRAVNVLTQKGYEIEPSFARPLMMPSVCRPENPWHLAIAQEIPLRASDGTHYVDLHWQLGLRFWRAFAPEVDKAWERSEDRLIGPTRVLALCPEDLFLALCYHGATHRWVLLKWLLDIAELLGQRKKLDWARMEEMTKSRPELRAAVSLGVTLAHEVLDAPVPQGAREILRVSQRVRALATAIHHEVLIRGKSSGSEHQTLMQLETSRMAVMNCYIVRFIRYPIGILSEVFVQVSQKDRAAVPLPQHAEFLYHLIRPARLTVKHGIRLIRALWGFVGRSRIATARDRDMQPASEQRS